MRDVPPTPHLNNIPSADRTLSLIIIVRRELLLVIPMSYGAGTVARLMRVGPAVSCQRAESGGSRSTH